MDATTVDVSTRSRRPEFGIYIAALGVVYGDIGTSPLYAFKAALGHFGDRSISEYEIFGILSLIFWSLIAVVTVKYVMLIMRADNHGEGGVLALTALAQRASATEGMRGFVLLVGIAGACLFFGDGIITPAISVLSAVEGLEVSSPQLAHFVLPISAMVIILLFALQHYGTGRIGRLFGPVMALWFISLGLLGIIQIIGHPYVLHALSPVYAIELCITYKWLAFLALGSVVLCVTGAEALYLDMGHFGPRPIRLTWICFVLPALVLNYFGQGALIITNPAAVANPFFLTVPEWLRLPFVALAAAATVIASQAVISGAFSITRQCMQLGLLPRMTVCHTSSIEEGQIYVPQINTCLAIGVLLLICWFKTSENLAAAYGIAVTGTFISDTVLAVVVFRRLFHWHRTVIILVFGVLFFVDVTFFAANTLKIIDGGWVPLAFGLLLMAVITSWKRGRDLLFMRWTQESLSLLTFIERLPESRVIRVPGLAVFLTGNPDYVPNALLHNMKHNKVLHERVLFVTVRNLDVPLANNRMEVEELASDIQRVTLSYGFMESPNVPRDLEHLPEHGVAFKGMQASYFLGREEMVSAEVPKLIFWRRGLFLLMTRNATSVTQFFQIPPDRVVELGVRIAI